MTQRTLQMQSAAQAQCPFAHAQQTKASMVGHGVVHALAIVMHTQCQAMWGEQAQLHLDPRGVGVFGHIRQTLLQQAVNRHAHIVIQMRWQRLRFECADDPIAGLPLLAMDRQGIGQTHAVQDRRTQTLQQISCQP